MHKHLHRILRQLLRVYVHYGRISSLPVDYLAVEMEGAFHALVVVWCAFGEYHLELGHMLGVGGIHAMHPVLSPRRLFFRQIGLSQHVLIKIFGVCVCLISTRESGKIRHARLTLGVISNVIVIERNQHPTVGTYQRRFMREHVLGGTQ